MFRVANSEQFEELHKISDTFPIFFCSFKTYMNTTMKKSSIVFLFCSFFSLVLKAQPSFTVSNKDDARAISQTILGVVLAEKDEKIVKRLKKPENLKAYEEGITNLNKLLTEIVPKEWGFSKSVQIMTKAEAEKLKEQKNPGYCLLSVSEETNYNMSDFYYMNPKGDFNSPRNFAYNTHAYGACLSLAIVPAWKPKDEVVVSFLPAAGFSKGSITFVVRNLENQLRDCLEKDVTKLSAFKDQMEKKTPGLKTKTLLLFDPLIGKSLQKVIEQKELDKYYNYKLEVVSFEKADEIIASKSSEYAYIWVVPASARSYLNYFIIDAEDSRPMFHSPVQVLSPSEGQGFIQSQLAKVSKEIGGR
jgi:hypothetical protein